ncbi:MAG: OmpA family protein [Bdellovibrionales bacterium]|nr:OmpA family protein [Bdellovibrionales bacterium]
MKPKNKQKLILILVLLVVGVFSNSNAQSINSHFFRFSDTLETFQLEDALGPDSELYKHRFLLRLSYDYINKPLIRLDAGRNTQTGIVVNDIHSIQFGGAVMLSDRLLFGLTVPFHFSSVNGAEVVATDPDAWELGDIGWKLKWRLTSDESKVNFAVMPWGFFPTGRNDQDNNYLISDDSWGFGGMLLADTTFANIVTIYGNVGVSGANNAEFATVDRRFRVDTGVGAFARITKMLGVNFELINGYTLSSISRDQNPIQIQVGLRGKFGPVRAFAGTGLEAFRSSRSSDGSFQGGIKVPFGNREEKPIELPEPEPEPSISTKIQILKDNLSVRREINFETDKAIILPESYGELDSAAEVILKYAEYISMITIEGHTDSRGSVAHNQGLSERRAQSVRTYLINKGVPAEKLSSVGYGESRLKVKEVDAETLRINRRVEFVVEETIETEQKVEVIEHADGTKEERVIDESINVIE